MLEWETAATTAARAAGLVGHKGLRRFVAEMMASPVDRGRRAAAIIVWRRDALPGRRAVPAAVGCWRRRWPIGSACRSARACGRSTTTSARRLRRTARKTWRYFDTFVTEADGWLPPDNFQESEQAHTGRAAHVADQHRHEPAVDAGGARSRLPVHRRSGAAARRDAAHARGPRALSRTLSQLVRHGDAGAAASALRLHRRQRQSRGVARSRSRRACSSSSSAADAATSGSTGWPTRRSLLAAASSSDRHGCGAARRSSPTINRLARAIALAAQARCSRRRRDRRVATIARALQPLAGELTTAVQPIAPVDEREDTHDSPTGRRGARGDRAPRRRTSRCRRDALHGARAPDARAGRRHALRFPLRPAAPHLSPSATGWPTPTVPGGSTRRSTTCSPRKRGWPASSRSPRATCRSTTGSISAASSPTSTAAPR